MVFTVGQSDAFWEACLQVELPCQQLHSAPASQSFPQPAAFCRAAEGRRWVGRWRRCKAWLNREG